MATEQQLIDALIKADSSGDELGAKVIADEIKKLRSQTRLEEGAAELPPAMEGEAPLQLPERTPEATIGEQAVGAAETALTALTGATGGAAGYVGGALGGLAGAVAEGEFGTPEAAQRIKEAAESGAAGLTYAPRTEAGREQVQALGEAAAPLAALAPLSGELAAIQAGAKGAVPAVREGARAGMETLGSAAKPLSERAGTFIDEAIATFKAGGPAKKKIAEIIESDPQNADIAKYIRTGSGRVKADPLAKESIKQGFDEPVIAAVKGATDTDRKKMLQMVNIMKTGKKNAVYAAQNRPTDIVGNSVVDRVNKVFVENRKSGKRLESAANSLKGKNVDYSPAVQNFTDNLKESGVRLEMSSGGKIKPVFKGADFEGDKTAERIIKKMVDRLSSTDKPDAYGVHRAKRFIDSQVSYGKQKRGLSGQAERIVKQLRSDLDSVLDAEFDDYRLANETYAMTRRSLDDLQKAAGTSIDLTGENANKALGTAMRRILSNAQSRTNMIDSLRSLNDSIKSTGGKLNDDIITQVIFADELDRMFGAAAKTSLKGQTEQAFRKGADVARRGIGDVAVDVAGKAIERARGINEDNAIKAIERLLKESR